MSRIIVVPDVHGRTFWREVLNNTEDKIVFLSYIATIDTFKIETHKRSSMDMFKSNPNNKKFNK